MTITGKEKELILTNYTITKKINKWSKRGDDWFQIINLNPSNRDERVFRCYKNMFEIPSWEKLEKSEFDNQKAIVVIYEPVKKVNSVKNWVKDIEIKNK